MLIKQTEINFRGRKRSMRTIKMLRVHRMFLSKLVRPAWTDLSARFRRARYAVYMTFTTGGYNRGFAIGSSPRKCLKNHCFRIMYRKRQECAIRDGQRIFNQTTQPLLTPYALTNLGGFFFKLPVNTTSHRILQCVQYTCREYSRKQKFTYTCIYLQKSTGNYTILRLTLCQQQTTIINPCYQSRQKATMLPVSACCSLATCNLLFWDFWTLCIHFFETQMFTNVHVQIKDVHKTTFLVFTIIWS
jgi:hypothetical protein